MTSDPQFKTDTRDDEEPATPIQRSAAQRQRAYRLRRKRTVIDAIGEEASASRVTLLTLLGYELAALDDGTTPATLIEARRNSLKRILATIVTRYGIDLTD
ncbi:hypothetical protein [Paraburkholderia aromaticivorans]|uniref:hypothetical protein n=1 Tax=Paraburkholderia aromaticivorans TaxID=2026199 RepID=UPI001455F377|nr:hypothetical protein [Paraburkholderia aromaticivorans]